MGVTEKLIKYSLVTLTIFSHLLSLAKVKVKSVVSYFDQDSDQGKQVIDESGDESTTVIEPVFFIDWEVSEKTDFHSKIVIDSWSAASDTALDANTGASGNGGITNQARLAGEVGLTHELKNKNKLGAKLGYSGEYDYKSLYIGGSYEASFAQDNFSLSADLMYFKDQTKDFDLLTNSPTAFENKDTISLGLNASQILTPKDIIQFSSSFITQSGLLSGIASTVNLGGSRVNEVLPDSRFRYALGTTWVHGFSETLAFSLAYRYYGDDWGISSHTITPMIRLSLLEDKAYLEFSYRYYTQSESKYFQDSFTSQEEFMTSHSRYEDFSASQLGSQFQYTIEGSKRDYIFGLGAYYYMRSGGSKSMIGQVSFGTNF